jgi:uncharacterized protein (DUF1697 family)
MKELQALFEKLGHINIKTILNSGNVVFDTEKAESALKSDIEKAIESTFGFTVFVQIKQFADFEWLIETDPFQGKTDSKEIKHNVTFLPEKMGEPSVPEGCHYDILGLEKNMLFTWVNIKKASSIDLMAFLDKSFGKEVTTRTWNTVKRIAACR